ncbi:hypothetical protein K1719_010399 [Acacia pycnantha]|nr:hypothetical protein K1719_010399 [Acacia pycnantha]
MRKLCPNFDNKEGLETVLEVPFPEEMLRSLGSSTFSRWNNLRSLMKAQPIDGNYSHLASSSRNEFMALLKLVGSPLVPIQVQSDQSLLTRPLRDCSTEDSTAKYIVQQYVAATGGQAALNALKSMYVMGQVRMLGAEMQMGEDSVHTGGRPEFGGFELWQKNPSLWFLQLVVSGFKVSAGSDGKVAWNQSSSHHFHANRGPPRPLRRFFQGLDPRYTANLFLDAVFVGEKAIENEECFSLRLETSMHILQAQSSPNTELVRHTIWGYFSQRTGLLVKFEDNKLVRVKPPQGSNDLVFWETNIESVMEDYRSVDGINIAHGGTTVATLHRYGGLHNQKRKVEETWKIEEVGFNIHGLSDDYFLPPSF